MFDIDQIKADMDEACARDPKLAAYRDFLAQWPANKHLPGPGHPAFTEWKAKVLG